MISTTTTLRVSKYDGNIFKCHTHTHTYIKILLLRASRNLKLAIIFKIYFLICYQIKLHYKEYKF